MLRFVNGPAYNVQLTNIAGQVLYTHNGEYDGRESISLESLPTSTYIVTWDDCIGINQSQQFTYNDLGIGSDTASPALYGPPGNTVDSLLTNSFNTIYYTISNTNRSTGAPLTVGDTLYSNSGHTSTVPNGTFLFANGKIYTVSGGSGVISNITTYTGDIYTKFSRPYYFNNTANFRIKLTSAPQYTPVVGNCYTFTDTTQSPVKYLTGTVSAYSAGTGIITLASGWTYDAGSGCES